MGLSLQPPPDVAVIGGGPAGLFAAECLAAHGFRVSLFDAKASVGRKFLVAGRGGLNLTHSEHLDLFSARYSGPPDWWRSALAEFPPNALREWAAGLGVETFVGTSGRVFPTGMQGGQLLRRWVLRLRGAGVQFFARHRLTALLPPSRAKSDGWHLSFAASVPGHGQVEARAVLLAMGGASWPETGSDGSWQALLGSLGLEVAPLVAANCAWLVDWKQDALQDCEGLPLKNIAVSAAAPSGKAPSHQVPWVKGELVVTAAGLEGGPIYRQGPVLRSLELPQILIDLKPDLSVEALTRRLSPVPPRNIADAVRVLKLPRAAGAILRQAEAITRLGQAIFLKAVPIALSEPGPINRAISTAGGVRFFQLTESLMDRQRPGLFFAGEMLHWEAPTGGYLLQGAFATAHRAAAGISDYLRA